tara:strand:+ start:719 stop:1030 length:312 start_codon:yes stop_codon:yes gene_type:complete
MFDEPTCCELDHDKEEEMLGKLVEHMGFPTRLHALVDMASMMKRGTPDWMPPDMQETVIEGMLRTIRYLHHTLGKDKADICYTIVEGMADGSIPRCEMEHLPR